jgi:hypothetical protein
MKVKVVLAAAALLLLGLLTVSPASAQYVGGQPPKAGPTAGPVVKVQAPVSPARVQAGRVTAARAAQQRGRLALTGGDVAQMALIGGAFVIGGTVLVRRSRQAAPRAS